MVTTRRTALHVENMNLLLRTLSKMGKEASDEVRSASTTLAERFLSQVRAEASSGPESIAAKGLRVYRDRVPKVGHSAGAKAGVSGGAKLSYFFGGHEFGSRQGPTTRQFPGIAPGDGYFFYEVINREGPKMASDYFKVITDVMGGEWDKGATRAAMS